MWAFVNLHAKATSSEELNSASSVMAMAASHLGEKGMDTTMSVHHFDPDAPAEPDYETMYNELKEAVSNLAEEWYETETQYKHKMAHEMLFRTGLSQ